MDYSTNRVLILFDTFRTQPVLFLLIISDQLSMNQYSVDIRNLLFDILFQGPGNIMYGTV
ncbi:hypothetical protein DV872_20120 [Oceanispirochaeta sp. M1]|nr:hypothetical protein DV872_20120 [Oceanispirochaeta sp. M1]